MVFVKFASTICVITFYLCNFGAFSLRHHNKIKDCITMQRILRQDIIDKGKQAILKMRDSPKRNGLSDMTFAESKEEN